MTTEETGSRGLRDVHKWPNGVAGYGLVGLGCFMSLAVRLLKELLAGSWPACLLFFCKMVEVDLFYSCPSTRLSRIFARVMGYDLINNCILLPDGASKCLALITSPKALHVKLGWS